MLTSPNPSRRSGRNTERGVGVPDLHEPLIGGQTDKRTAADYLDTMKALTPSLIYPKVYGSIN